MKIKLATALIFAAICAHGQQLAVIGVNAAPLYHDADYESPLETQELLGETVQILDRDRYWVKIQTPQPYVAWVNEKALVPMEETGGSYGNSRFAMVTALHSYVYASPSFGSDTIFDLLMCNRVRLDMGDGAKPQVKGSFMHVILPDGHQGWVPRKDLCLIGSEGVIEGLESATLPARREMVTATARKMLGAPYLWGGMSPAGLDCSGLVRLSFLRIGVRLPRNASQQYLHGQDLPIIGDDGKTDFSQLQPADLLFFGSMREDGTARITHVGIYLGQGRMIHASQLVRINSLEQGREDCYENAHKLCKACRILR